MSNIETHTHEELIGLLPFYLSGKIEEDDKRAVMEWLERDPDAAFILEKVEAERQASIEVNEAVKAPHDGLARLMKDVAATRQNVPLSVKGGSLLASLKDRILSPLQAAPSELAWGLCGLLMLVTIGQSTLLYNGNAGTTPPGFELASGEKHTILASGIVKFSETVQMEAVTELLDEAGVIIIDGPTASGQYVIGFIERDGLPELSERQKHFKARSDVVTLFVVKGGK